MSLKKGEILKNKYRINRLLGKGSMGNVYLVESLKDGKELVVKELILSNETGLSCENATKIFHREAEFMSRFNHRGLAEYHGIFDVSGREYILMEFINGDTLEKIINSNKIPLSEDLSIKWTIQIAKILDYLHNSFEMPIVYRDLKPSNIIINKNNDPVIIDFGITRYYDPDKNTDTFRLGSPGYAAPEQYKHRGQSSPQTDIYALGVILYQMLTKYDPSITPFKFPPIKSINPSVSNELEEIINRSLQMNPLKRHISIKEFKENLERYIKKNVHTEEIPDLLPALTKKSLPVKKDKEIKESRLTFAGNIISWAGLIIMLNAFSVISDEIDISNSIPFFKIFAVCLIPLSGLFVAVLGNKNRVLKEKKFYKDDSFVPVGCNFFVLLLFAIMLLCAILHIYVEPEYFP